MKFPNAPKGEKATERPRDRGQTATALKLALANLEKSNQRISISAVATSVGVTPALIHNKYPDIAEAIRQKIGKANRTQRDEKQVQLAQAQDAIRDLKREMEELKGDVKKLASINEVLRRQLLEAQAIAMSKNVVILASKGRDIHKS